MRGSASLWTCKRRAASVGRRRSVWANGMVRTGATCVTRTLGAVIPHRGAAVTHVFEAWTRSRRPLGIAGFARQAAVHHEKPDGAGIHGTWTVASWTNHRVR